MLHSNDVSSRDHRQINDMVIMSAQHAILNILHIYIYMCVCVCVCVCMCVREYIYIYIYAQTHI